MRRIYFLVPDIETTRKIVDEMLLARVEERRIHVLARRGTPLEDLPEATFMQKTDFLPALEQGVALGGATGMLAGLVALAFPAGLVLGGGAVLAASLAGAGLGAWWSSMIGAGVGNRHLKDYEEAVDKGQLLVMVDVPKGKVEKIEALVKEHHPGAECKGVEATIPAFP
ncbi:MAG: transrane protein [Rhodocyclaceae bacterium]|nr:transrane protein [Rhodocyclaceae bacterium]